MGRLPSHTFMDYCLTYLVFVTVCALTLGQLGPPAYSPEGQSLQFLDQLLRQPTNWPMVLFALGGGTCLAFGGEPQLQAHSRCPPPCSSTHPHPSSCSQSLLPADLALQYSIGLCGLSVGPPILNSITLVVSVVLAYFLDGGINKPQLVFTGAAAAAVAVGLGAAAHVVIQQAPKGASNKRSNGDCSAAQRQQQQGLQPEDSAHGLAAADQKQPGSTTSDCEQGGNSSTALEVQGSKQPHGRSITASRKASLYLGLCLSVLGESLGDGTCQPQCLAAVLQSTVLVAPLTASTPTLKSHLVFAAAGGVIYGCFMPAFQIAANDPFKLLPPPTPPLSVYTTYFWFAVSFTGVSGAVNVLLMYRPPLGISPSSLGAYLRDNRGRALSVFSGMLAGAGDMCQFMGGQTAGYAAAMMVMAYPVVGVLWGLLCFKEVRRAPAGGSRVPWGLVLVLSQVVMYMLSVGLLSGSAELRGH
jgi:hypothetical protein